MTPLLGPSDVLGQELYRNQKQILNKLYYHCYLCYYSDNNNIITANYCHYWCRQCRRQLTKTTMCSNQLLFVSSSSQLSDSRTSLALKELELQATTWFNTRLNKFIFHSTLQFCILFMFKLFSIPITRLFLLNKLWLTFLRRLLIM